MKKHYALLVILWLLTIGAFRAQGQATDSLRLGLDQIFANLDKSQIPTERLAEYATPLLSLTPFNGTLTDSSLTNVNAFRMLYATLLTARVAGDEPLPNLDEVNARLAAQETQETIPIATLYANYNTLRPDALSSNLLRVQDRSAI